MARINKLYEKPLATSIGLSDKVTVGQLVDGEYKVKTMLYSTFLAQIIDDTLVLIVTRAQLQALIAGSSLGIGVRYIITNAVGSTLSLLTQAVSTTVLDEIAIQITNGNNVAYDITTDIATAIQQTQINGNGFVKAVGTTLSYDNSTYLTTIEGIAAGGELEGNYASPTLKNSSVVGKVLTGLSISGSTVLSTDSILTGIGKLQNQVNGLAGGVEYQGTWNASTNTPALASGVGTQGYYYVVSVAGSTNLDGITTWELGDWAIFNGTTWQKVDNTDAVVSVNGYTGIVTLSAADVSAVPTSAISGTSGTVALFGASNSLGNSVIRQVSGNIITNAATDTGEHFIIGGSARVNGTLLVTSNLDINGTTLNLGNNTIVDSYTGNSSTYRVLVLTNGTTNTNIGLNYNPNTNAGGSFNGTGQIFIANNKGILASNSAGDNYIGVLRPVGTGVYFGGSLTSGDLTGDGLFISTTGAATFSSSVAIGNTVSASVATPSTHKVTMVIGGVTYYLLATNV
jgi:hypothetical protein